MRDEPKDGRPEPPPSTRRCLVTKFPDLFVGHYATVPPHEEPDPAVQPKQWSAVRI